VTMTPFEAYQTYLAIKNHFTTDWYNYFKYNGKTNAKHESFKTRKDVFVFAKLARHKDPKGLCISNIIKDPKIWSKHLVYSDDCERTYTEWLKKHQALVNVVRNDLSKLDENFDSNFKVTDGQHPILLKLYMSDEIEPETLCILVDLVGCMKYWNKELKDDVLWNDIQSFITKYTPFLEYDKSKVKTLVVDFFSN
jgi:hypothetical protein